MIASSLPPASAAERAKIWSRSVCQAEDARYVRRMFGYGRADRCINQGGCGAGQAPVPADGDPGMPVIRPACSGSVIREVVIRRRRSAGWFRYQPFLVPKVD